MTDTVSVPLGWSIGTRSSLTLAAAEWWNDDSRFVLIKYTLRGIEQELGLRLDLDKRVFLDRVGDSELDAALASTAIEVCAAVSKVKTQRHVAHIH